MVGAAEGEDGIGEIEGAIDGVGIADDEGVGVEGVVVGVGQFNSPQGDVTYSNSLCSRITLPARIVIEPSTTKTTKAKRGANIPFFTLISA